MRAVDHHDECLACSLDEAVVLIRRHVCPAAESIGYRYGIVDGAVAVIVQIVAPVWWCLLLGGLHGRVRRLAQHVLNATSMSPSVERRIIRIETAWPWRTSR